MRRKLRLAMFTDSFYPELGGIQDSVTTSARELGRRGHEICIFAPTASAKDYRRAGLPPGEIDLGPNVRVIRLASMGIASSTQQSRLVLPTGQRWRELASFRPHLVHTHSFLGAGLEGRRAARKLEVPLIGTNHWAAGAFASFAPVPDGAKIALRRAVSRAVARYYDSCDWTTGPSAAVIADMQLHGMRQGCQVISNPIDTTLFRPFNPAERSRLKAEYRFSDATILFAGRLAAEKSIDVLIRAVATLRPTMPDIMLVLVGHGSAREALEKLAAQLGVTRHIRFVGTVSHEILATLYNAADVFAIASTTETQSMVLLQAMSCGMPTVSANRGGLIEYARAGGGLLAEPGQPLDFAAKLGQTLQQPALRARMQANAVRCAASCSVDSVVDAWEDLYTRLVHASAPSRAVRVEPLPFQQTR
jgi:glycosyltransferase involved in cell wall biosynthesis